MGRQRSGPKCLAEDLRRYSNWIKLKAEALIGDQYPKTTITKAMSEEQPELKPLVGRELTNIAWLWARTVKSPNPAFSHVDVPLVANFVVCRKDDQEVYVQPIVSGDKYRFKIVNGKPPIGADQGTKQSRGANFTCIMSGSPIEPSYIYKEAQAGRMGTRLMAIVAEGPRRRIYLAPTLEAEKAARVNEPKWRPETLMPENPRWFSPPLYGLKGFGDLFTARQLVALTTLSDLVTEAISQCEKDAISKGMANDGVSLDQGGKGARAYSQAVGVYLSFVVDRCADFSNSCTRWVPGNQKVMNLYGKQAIGMTWDFPEAAILENTVGGFIPAAEYIADCLETLPSAVQQGRVQQEDAADSESSKLRVVSTDPPYYDNIGYADLSDFFYPWLRRSLGEVFPKLFSAESVPKAKELVATPYRHGGKANAETFFLNGMTTAIENLAHFAHPAFPVTIYYARQPLYSGHSDYIDIVLMFNKSPRWTIAMASAGAVSPIEPCILSSL
jgi:putative DNA methylase